MRGGVVHLREGLLKRGQVLPVDEFLQSGLPPSGRFAILIRLKRLALRDVPPRDHFSGQHVTTDMYHTLRSLLLGSLLLVNIAHNP